MNIKKDNAKKEKWHGVLTDGFLIPVVIDIAKAIRFDFMGLF